MIFFLQNIFSLLRGIQKKFICKTNFSSCPRILKSVLQEEDWTDRIF